MTVRRKSLIWMDRLSNINLMIYFIFDFINVFFYCFSPRFFLEFIIFKSSFPRDCLSIEFLVSQNKFDPLDEREKMLWAIQLTLSKNRAPRLFDERAPIRHLRRRKTASGTTPSSIFAFIKNKSGFMIIAHNLIRN